MLPTSKIVSALIAVLLLAGCAGGGMTILYRVTGGEKVAIEMSSSKGIAPVKNRYVSIPAVNCPPAADKKMAYAFTVIELQPDTIARITVEDVSEEHQSFPMLDDTAPVFNVIKEQRVWRGLSPAMSITDSRIAWIYHIEPTTQVFRFTLYTKSGEKTVIHQAAFIPPLVKAFMRSVMETKEEPTQH